MSRVIIALTSYPGRIRNIQWVLDSIMAQTYKIDKVVLYLSDEQFVGRKLPVDLSAYFSQGLEIHWCQGDMKSHKKYLYAFKEYPDDYIVTIDDDYYYERHMVEELVQYTDIFPRCILARITHLITSKRKGGISSYEKWWKECMHYIGMPHMDLFAVGCAGILYPPHILTDEVFNVDNIIKYCMYADDVWLKVMELISGIPIVQVPTRMLDRCDDIFVENGLYQQYNKKGGNDRQLHGVLNFYNNFNETRMSLTERIFSTGIVYEDEVAQKQENDKFRIAEEWLDRVSSSSYNIIIYGAGTVAKRFYWLLDKQGVIEKIKAFAVEDTDENVNAIGNIKIVQYKAVDYTNAICIIALKDWKERYRVSWKLHEIGLDEDRILSLNVQVYQALYDFWKKNI